MAHEIVKKSYSALLKFIAMNVKTPSKMEFA